MSEALSIVAASMGFDTERLQSIAHNLANVTTNGYKRDVLVRQSGIQPFDQHLQVAGAEVSTVRATDTREGALRSTGNPLDLAIEGPSFFELKTASGTRYTRAGLFQLDQHGQLVNQAGAAVMGVNGPINLSTATPVIDKLGRIFEKDVQVGQIKMVSFTDIRQLEYLGDGSYDASNAHSVEQQENSQMRQGFVEASNVSSMHEMVRMVETLRHFESMQKVVQGMDSAHETVISKLGQF